MYKKEFGVSMPILKRQILLADQMSGKLRGKRQGDMDGIAELLSYMNASLKEHGTIRVYADYKDE